MKSQLMRQRPSSSAPPLNKTAAHTQGCAEDGHDTPDHLLVI